MVETKSEDENNLTEETKRQMPLVKWASESFTDAELDLDDLEKFSSTTRNELTKYESLDLVL